MSNCRTTELATKLINSHAAPADIFNSLVAQGVSMCVAEEWAQEPHRRQLLSERREKRQMKTTNIGLKGEDNRRWIKEDLIDRSHLGLPNFYEIFHATKGRRKRRAFA